MNIEKKIKAQFPVDTLLRQFILREIASHKAPIRKGRPRTRGQEIGMGKEKFIGAILYGTTNLSLKEISDLSGCAYGSLRNSVKHKSFVTVANGELGAFSTMAMEYLRGRVDAIQKAVNDGKDFYEEMAGEAPVFDDTRFFREQVFPQICELYYKNFTSAAALVACPRDMFSRIARIVFAVQFPGRSRWIVERAFLDRVNEFLRLHKRDRRAGVRLDPMMAQLIELYVDLEHQYNAEAK
jgi:hypothetical protein